ncbi:MAG: LuxR C-terminal-related transcriptional regulator [Streptosporangiaceae bacterium]
MGAGGLADAERGLQEGAALAREIGRPCVEVSCLAQLGFASKIRPFATTQRRCREAIALAERYGWGGEWVIAPALITLTGALIWTGEFDEGERWFARALQAGQADSGPDIGLLLHHTTGMLHGCRGRHHEAFEEFGAADRLQSQLAGSHALASQVTGWLLAAQARLGRTGDARAALAALDDERAGSGEIRNARAVIGLAGGDPAAALRAVRDVLDGTAPVIGYVTMVEAQLLAGLAHRKLGDQRAANQAAERALSLAQADRLVLPFAMTGAGDLLEALPPHTRHAALRADILDVLPGPPPLARSPYPAPPAGELSPGELRVLRYLPTNLSRPEIAGELSVSLDTVNTHLRSIYAKLQVRSRTARRGTAAARDRPHAQPCDHLGMASGRLAEAERVAQLSAPTRRAEQVLAQLDEDERASAEMRIAAATLRLATGDPRAAADALVPVLDGPVSGATRMQIVTALLVSARARGELGVRQARRSQPPRGGGPRPRAWPARAVGTKGVTRRYLVVARHPRR